MTSPCPAQASIQAADYLDAGSLFLGFCTTDLTFHAILVGFAAWESANIRLVPDGSGTNLARKR